ncbi:MAG: DUF2971 domain-containing protein, partial [Nitrospirota bacterium]
MSIVSIANELFAAKPDKALFHYTSLGALDGITRDRGLRATDIHYFNDAAEMRHIMHLLNVGIDKRIETESEHQKLLRQFREWISHRLPDGNMLFVASFTANGNLLSQWRAYCPVGKGVSLGFDPALVLRCAVRQTFHVGQCIYDSNAQLTLAGRILDSVIELAALRGEASPNKKYPTQSYHLVFEEIEDTLLVIGALVKHPSFQEEQEWRAISPVFTNYVETPIQYREGASMLIPYLPFSLSDDPSGLLTFQEIFVGPTPNVGLSMNSVSRFLRRNRSAGDLPPAVRPPVQFPHADTP